MKSISFWYTCQKRSKPAFNLCRSGGCLWVRCGKSSTKQPNQRGTAGRVKPFLMPLALCWSAFEGNRGGIVEGWTWYGCNVMRWKSLGWWGGGCHLLRCGHRGGDEMEAQAGRAGEHEETQTQRRGWPSGDTFPHPQKPTHLSWRCYHIFLDYLDTIPSATIVAPEVKLWPR